MNHFAYQNAELFCEGVSLAQVARDVGTPVYVYSHAALTEQYQVFAGALANKGQKHLICYSVKANSNLAVLRTLARLGAGVDTVSRGEIYRALKAGVPANKIVFSGIGKRVDEISYGLEQGILAFNIESLAELETIQEVAAHRRVRAPVTFRVNPDVDPQTHPYISTGLKKNKFGIPLGWAKDAYIKAQKMANIEIVGLDCHIGSQLTKTEPFRDALLRLVDLIHDLQKAGVAIRYLDIGGGLGIPYKDEEPPTPDAYAQAIKQALEAVKELDLTLICEPGRFIAGNAGALVTSTLYVKHNEIKNFVIVDAAMNDLIRPAFYDSYHAIWPVKQQRGEKYVADFVGPICETGDFFARDRELAHQPQSGDLLALMSAGAYGFTMSSNYNTRPRAAEVLVHGKEFSVVRKREELDDLLRGESIPAFLT